MDRYLIINADDFGMSHASNLAVMDLFERGGAITSSTIMAPCCWAKEAGVWASKHPEFSVGVHLTFTSEWKNYRWGPVNRDSTASLRDDEGFMYYESDEFEKKSNIDEVTAEIIAQIERIRSFGFEPSHLDNHMGSLYGIETGRFELLQTTLAVAGKYGLPFRIPGKFSPQMLTNSMLDIKIDERMIRGIFDKVNAFAASQKVAIPDNLIPGDWSGPQKESYENYKEYIYELYRQFPEGVTETYIHPAIECEEIKGITGSWERRVWEYKLFSDPQTKQHIDSLGIKLISYRDLKKMRGY